MYPFGPYGEPQTVRYDANGRRVYDNNQYYDRRITDRFSTNRNPPPVVPPPVITRTSPFVRDRQYVPPGGTRPNQYDEFMRASETPPPRRSRNNVPRYGETFGDVRTRRGNSDRLQYEPSGPPNPYTSSQYAQNRPNMPYGGYGQPRNLYAPGGRRYDRSLQYEEQQPREESRYTIEEVQRRRYARQVAMSGVWLGSASTS